MSETKEIKSWLREIKPDLKEVINRDIVQAKRLQTEIDGVGIEVEVRESMETGQEYEMVLDINARDTNHHAAKWTEVIKSTIIEQHTNQDVPSFNRHNIDMCDSRQLVTPKDIKKY